MTEQPKLQLQSCSVVAVPNWQMTIIFAHSALQPAGQRLQLRHSRQRSCYAHQQMSITVPTAGQPLQDINKQAPQLELLLMPTWKMSTTLRTVSSSLFASHCNA